MTQGERVLRALDKAREQLNADLNTCVTLYRKRFGAHVVDDNVCDLWAVMSAVNHRLNDIEMAATGRLRTGAPEPPK